MRILISCVGTRGDVQPAIALALALRQLDCEVRLCVPPNFVAWARNLWFDALPIGMEMRPPKPGEAPPVIPDLIANQFDTVAAAAEDCDLILGAGAHQYAGRSIAELRGIPFIDAVYAPTSLPSPDLAPAGPAASANDIPRLWAETRRAWNGRSLDRVNANRARLGLAPIDDVISHILGGRVLLAADPLLGPARATPGIEVVQTGAWLLEDSTPLPPGIEAFLDAGEPPIYLGLGSMPAPEGTSGRLIAAARAAGRRVILSKGWAGLDLVDEAADCMMVDEVNQQRLFPRLAAVVHHGGAGTATAAARAGVPQLVTPMFSDQFYWGRRIETLGLGMAVPFARMEAEVIAEVLAQVLKPEIASQAIAVSGTIVADGAALAACRLIETARG
ncbi:MAG: gtfE [Caulobacteraceae bacterium]|nr:gtfE [Caulobacteraceae bacterium]